MQLRSLADVRAYRLIAQGLATSAALSLPATPAAAARRMLASQGQTYEAGLGALALRSGTDVDAVRAQVANYQIARCWPQRGTLHFMATEDVRWLSKLTNPRIEKGAAGRRAGLGLSPEDVVKARTAFHAALHERGTASPLTRKQAYQVFADAGVDPSEYRGQHLLRAFGGEGDVIQGPKIGSEETFVHLDDVPVPQRALVGDDALAELGTRYFTTRGPATVKDLAWWVGMPVSVARKAAELAVGTASVTLEGATYHYGQWLDGVTPAELKRAVRKVHLLPAFDEYLLAYTDRAGALPEELRHQVLTSNGISWAFTVTNGIVTGRTH